ncbi:MAG: FxLYD domain-containing protein [Chloroflexota bacterium]
MPREGLVVAMSKPKVAAFIVAVAAIFVVAVAPSAMAQLPYHTYLPLVLKNTSLIPQPSPTPTLPQPSPTPTPPRITIVGQPSYWCTIGPQGPFHSIQGELRNDGSETRYSVSVTAIFYQGTTISAPALATMIRPGEKVPFRLVLWPTTLWCEAPFSLAVDSGTSSSPVSYTHQLEVTNTNLAPCGPMSFFNCITGQVRNPTSQRLEQVTVVWTGYDGQGQVTYADSGAVYTALDPGQTANFVISDEKGPLAFPPASSVFLGEGVINQ